MTIRHVIFASYGNDSIALIQWCYENGLTDCAVLYSDTGWAKDGWAERVARAEDWVETLGYQTVRTKSAGMIALVKSKQAFSSPAMPFCTGELKVMPSSDWLDLNDPAKRATCIVGVRREESKRRSTFETWRDHSPIHGDRALYGPLAEYVTADRDELIRAAGWEVLPHRSKECFPCVHANRADLRMLNEQPTRIDEIRALERDLGTTKAGKPKTFFRSGRYGDASGIDEVMRWANSERGEFVAAIDAGDNCDGGFCGS